MQERLKQINHYINNYESNKDSTVLNYYSIFELSESSDINLLMENIKNKKLKILFHPDLLAYIPEQNKQSFKVLSDAVTDMENIFSNSKSKLMYDENLKKANSQKNDQQMQSTKNISDLDRLNSIAITNILKHGFKFNVEAFGMIVKQGNFNGITKTKSSRTKADILGRKKIETILNFFTPKNVDAQNIDAKVINYYSYLLHQCPELKEKLDVYINACVETASKYNFDQVAYAINYVYQNYSDEEEIDNLYNGFTNNNSSRRKIKELVNPNDVIILSRIYLNIYKNDKYQNAEIYKMSDEQIITEFIDTLEEEFSKQNTTNHHR